MARLSALATLLAAGVVWASLVGADYDPDAYDGNYDAYAAPLGKDGDAELTDAFDDADEFGYGADYADPEYGGYGEDSQHYYGDEYDEYYDSYGMYGDQAGDDYFFDDAERSVTDCVVDDKGHAKTAEPACDIKISGVDAVADKLAGGVDGTYKMQGCWDGRPKYKRSNSLKDQERTLWFSRMFGDWDISAGPDVNEGSIILYGGEGREEARPNFVAADKWHLLSEHSSKGLGDTLDDFLPLKVHIKCADGKELKAAKDEGTYQPLLTDQEAEAKYRALYTRYGKKNDPDPSVNFTMVICMVLLGVGAVLGVPYVLFRKKDGTHGGGAKSFAQMLEEARKKRVGHTL